MALTYDFDMFSVIPKEVQAQVGGMFQELGMTGQMQEQRALFRDPAAVAALQGSSEDVKKCLLDSGFGINVYDSGAGPGRYPASDGPARAQVIERLMENLEKLPEDVDWNGFDIEAFAMAALTAKPVDTVSHSLDALRSDAAVRDQTPSAPPRGAQSSMDDFFSGRPMARPPVAQPAGPDMDSFFSNTGASAMPAPEAPASDMDSFFSGSPRTEAYAVPPRPMSADDIRSTIDTTPRRKSGFGPVKMMMMALGLFLVVAMLGNGTGATKLIEAATGGKMVTVSR
ncbi:MAG: hypothetical protein RIE24_25430 [Silicimonas sp.]